MSDSSRASAVKERWDFLAECLRSAGRAGGDQPLPPPPAHSPTQSTPVFRSSVRRFESFGLFEREPSPVAEEEEETEEEWDVEFVTYAAALGSGGGGGDAADDAGRARVDLRLYRQLPSLAALRAFNNTGNVCVWPSEECLAWFLLESAAAQLQRFPHVRSVVELGAGMAGLAGLVCALYWPSVERVLLTDGNERSVRNLAAVVDLNAHRWCAAGRSVDTAVLRWGGARSGAGGCPEPEEERFDLVLCADCLFFEDSHLDLLDTVDRLMAPGRGLCLCVAPERAGSFERFRRLAASRFPAVACLDRYSKRVSERHQELAAAGADYSADLHFPRMLSIGRRDEEAPGAAPHGL